jgi:DNA-binding transcriptional MerR regulator
MSVNVGKLRIGEVHTLLRKDFPDIELSKIRYYEDKGLVAPSRSAKGYRLYSERDVACLREAIRLAQEEFVPLRVVRLRLIEQGLLPDDGALSTARHAARETMSNVISISVPPPSVVGTARPSLSVLHTGVPTNDVVSQPSLATSSYLTLNEFLKSTGLDEESAIQLQMLGLLTPALVANEVVFTNLDARIAGAVNVLLTRGVEVRLLGSLRRNVEREVGVVEDLTQPLRAPGSHVSAEHAHEVVAAVASEVAALRVLLLERTLGEYLGR